MLAYFWSLRPRGELNLFSKVHEHVMEAYLCGEYKGFDKAQLRYAARNGMTENVEMSNF